MIHNFSIAHRYNYAYQLLLYHSYLYPYLIVFHIKYSKAFIFVYVSIPNKKKNAFSLNIEHVLYITYVIYTFFEILILLC